VELRHLRADCARLTERARIETATASELRSWLAVHHRQSESVWLVTSKKGQPDYIAYGEIVEELLCFGWVDSLPRALDATRSMLLISPRKPGSAWSKPNRDRVARLIAAGRMARSGLAKVEAAKRDGSWDLLKNAEAGIVPADLAEALARGCATENFDAFSAATRRRIIEFVVRAKRTDTRTARIARVVESARVGEDPLIWRPRGFPGTGGKPPR
jgi:uncharacterized protein YdeI (YjbR/CyaY-like superfamily)